MTTSKGFGSGDDTTVNMRNFCLEITPRDMSSFKVDNLNELLKKRIAIFVGGKSNDYIIYSIINKKEGKYLCFVEIATKQRSAGLSKKLNSIKKEYDFIETDFNCSYEISPTRLTEHGEKLMEALTNKEEWEQSIKPEFNSQSLKEAYARGVVSGNFFMFSLLDKENSLESISKEKELDTDMQPLQKEDNILSYFSNLGETVSFTFFNRNKRSDRNSVRVVTLSKLIALRVFMTGWAKTELTNKADYESDISKEQEGLLEAFKDEIIKKKAI